MTPRVLMAGSGCRTCSAATSAPWKTLVAAQIEAVFADPGVDAVKIGMLAEVGIIAAVADSLRRSVAGRSLPIVLDPVMIAKSGDPLLDADAVDHLQRLFPLATLVTPNLPEAERIGRAAGRSTATAMAATTAMAAMAATVEGRERLVRRLGDRCAAVLLKGGHAAGAAGEDLVDLLWDGSKVHAFVHPRIASRSTHGTGCSLSSAIAARLGRGENLVQAVSGAIDWLHEAIARAIPLGAGVGPVDHFWRQRPEAAGVPGRGCLA